MSKRIKPKWQLEKEKVRKNAKVSNTNASQAFKSLGDALSKISNIAKNFENKWSDVEWTCDALGTKCTTSKLDMLAARQKDFEQQLNDLNMRLRQLELELRPM